MWIGFHVAAVVSAEIPCVRSTVSTLVMSILRPRAIFVIFTFKIDAMARMLIVSSTLTLFGRQRVFDIIQEDCVTDGSTTE